MSSLSFQTLRFKIVDCSCLSFCCSRLGQLNSRLFACTRLPCPYLVGLSLYTLSLHDTRILRCLEQVHELSNTGAKLLSCLQAKHLLPTRCISAILPMELVQPMEAAVEYHFIARGTHFSTPSPL